MFSFAYIELQLAGHEHVTLLPEFHSCYKVCDNRKFDFIFRITKSITIVAVNLKLHSQYS